MNHENSGSDTPKSHSQPTPGRFAKLALEVGGHVDPEALRIGKYTPDGTRVPKDKQAAQAIENAKWLAAERARLEAAKGDLRAYAALSATHEHSVVPPEELAKFLATRAPLHNADDTDLNAKSQAAQQVAQELAAQLLAERAATGGETDAESGGETNADPNARYGLDAAWLRDAGSKMHAFDPKKIKAEKLKAPAKHTPARSEFLPMTREDMRARGWSQCDFILVTGDAYVDHPSFANGVISRVLEWAGYKVGIISQPDWTDTADVLRLGEPRLAFLVGGGNLDSMLNAFTAHKLPRSDDPYSPGGKPNCRPPRATIVYCNLLRRAFGKVPIIIGGIEASQRRFSHYDYWSDKVRRSILLDSNADLLVFGMGEAQIVEIAHRLNAGESVADLVDVRGTAFVRKDSEFLRTAEFAARFGEPVDVLPHDDLLPPQGASADRVQEHQPNGEPPTYRKNYARAFKQIYAEQDPVRGRPLVQRCGAMHVIQLPPARLQTEAELDRWYDLPYTRAVHPDYEAAGGVPAWRTTQHSIVTHRGCMGSCSFCAIWMHQGRTVQSRSIDSIERETVAITEMPSFKGYLADVGGPTANMYGNYCAAQQAVGACRDRDCLLPDPCPALKQHLGKQLDMLSRVRAVPGVKKAFIASGIRYDMLIDDKTTAGQGDAYIENLAANHTSGQLKVAPEHTSDAVLALMRKPSFAKYEAFKERFENSSRKVGKEQYLTAYFVSSHPGCTMDEQINLAEYFQEQNWSPQQVQDFIPTPMTPATAMFYSGFDPETLRLVYTPTTMKEKRRQRALMQFRKPEFHGRVRKALLEAGRNDLIGKGRGKLVPPGHTDDWDDDHPGRPAGIGDGPASSRDATRKPARGGHSRGGNGGSGSGGGRGKHPGGNRPPKSKGPKPNANANRGRSKPR